MLEVKEAPQLPKMIAHDWQPMSVSKRCFSHSLDQDKVFLKSEATQVKYLRNKAMRLTIYIGKEILELLNIPLESHLKIFSDVNSPHLLRLVKTTDLGSGYKLSMYTKGKTPYIAFRYHGNLILKELKTTPTPFDLYNDQSLIIDISQLKLKV